MPSETMSRRTPSLSHSHSRSDSDSTDTTPSISFDSFSAFGIDIPESTLDLDSFSHSRSPSSLDGPGVGQDNDVYMPSKRYSSTYSPSYSSSSHSQSRHSDRFAPSSPSSVTTVQRFSAASSTSTSTPTSATPRISVPPIQIRSPTRNISIPLYTPSLYRGSSPTSEYSSAATSAPPTPDPHTPNGSNGWFSGYNENPRIVFRSGTDDDEDGQGEQMGDSKLKRPRYAEAFSDEPVEVVELRETSSARSSTTAQPISPATATPSSSSQPTTSSAKDHLKPLKLLQRSDLFETPLPSPYDSQLFFLPKGYKRKNQMGKKNRTIVDAVLRERLRPMILVDKMVVGELKQPARRQTDPSSTLEPDSDRTERLRWRQWSSAGVLDPSSKPEVQASIRRKWEVDSRRWVNVHVAESYQWLLGTA